MAEARAWLDKAVAQIDEVSAADRERLSYLEQRSIDTHQATEDMFHAANNALFIMSVELELLTRHLQPECKHPEVRKWLMTMQAKIDEIKEVNGRLFAASAGGPLYRIHSFVSLRSVVQRTVDTYADVARRKRIPISWQLPDFAAITIWTDAIAIGTVLDNLVSNAIKFSKPGKEMTISITRSGTDLICAVCDQGPGLSKEDLGRIFQRGARLTPQPTGGESSSGYGLSITRDLVRKLGGRIWCESVEGKGTCFTFSLPREPKLAIERRARKRGPGEQRGASN
jgi:signal transduction histidine kinase